MSDHKPLESAHDATQSMIKALRARAEELCEGCASVWRIKDGYHVEPSGVRCTATEIRQAIRRLSGAQQP